MNITISRLSLLSLCILTTIAFAIERKLEPIDYHGVRLLDSRWLTQFKSAHDYYLLISQNDVLQACRVALADRCGR